MRQTNFTILKALAIICIVLSNAGVSGWLAGCLYSFHVPVFFICAGWFFSTHYLNDERTFIVRRLRGLYVPFVKWSLFFLLIHNLLFPLGLLSETYGNAAGGVTHPYTWTQFSASFWSILLNMSGYDQFLGGAFWFFRAFLLASVGFLVGFKLLRLSPHFQSDRAAGFALLILPLLAVTWMITADFKIAGISQGGFRELMGIFFIAAGFFYASIVWTSISVGGCCCLVWFSFYSP